MTRTLLLGAFGGGAVAFIWCVVSRIIFLGWTLTGFGPGVVFLFAMHVLGALCITWLLLKTYGLSYRDRVTFVLLVAVSGGFLCHLQYWSTGAFPIRYSLELLVDLGLTWLLAGLWIARVTVRQVKKESR